MRHIAEIKLSNYRSFREAACRLSPLTLIVGRNNSGKSNFLRAFQDHARHLLTPDDGNLDCACHYRFEYSFGDGPPPAIELRLSDGSTVGVSTARDWRAPKGVSQFKSMPEIYDFDPKMIGRAEPAEFAKGVSPRVLPDGKGVTSVLRMLLHGPGAMRKRFETIQQQWKKCLPEIMTLHFASTGPSELMVEQHAIPGSHPLSDLSEGARLMLAMLTLVHQENPPRLILLEDFDHKLHPRLFSDLVGFLRGLTGDGRTQMIATTHNPYLVDEFKDDPEAVVIVEKKDGCSTLVNMDERLRTFLAGGEELELPLGQVLFSGLADAPPPATIPVLT